MLAARGEWQARRRAQLNAAWWQIEGSRAECYSMGADGGSGGSQCSMIAYGCETAVESCEADEMHYCGC